MKVDATTIALIAIFFSIPASGWFTAASVNARIDGLTARMDGLEKTLSARIDGLGARLDGVEKAIISLDGRTCRVRRARFYR